MDALYYFSVFEDEVIGFSSKFGGGASLQFLLSADLIDELGDVLGAAPENGDAAAAVAVIVDYLSRRNQMKKMTLNISLFLPPTRLHFLAPNSFGLSLEAYGGPAGPESHPVLDLLGAVEQGREHGLGAGHDEVCVGGVGRGVPVVVLVGAAQNHALLTEIFI